MKASEWVQTLPSSLVQAQPAIIQAALDASMRIEPEWVGVVTEHGGHQGVLFVMCDALQVGEPGDAIRINVSCESQQIICDALGLQMPTEKMLDLAKRAVEVEIEPGLLHVDESGRVIINGQAVSMSSVAAMQEHNRIVSGAVNGRPGLLVNFGKGWFLGITLGPALEGGWKCLNYGWYSGKAPYLSRAGFQVWQQLSGRHNEKHVDYSQVLWAVHPIMLVDGQPMPTADVLRNPEMAGLISYDGALPFARHPRLPVVQIAQQTIAPPIETIRMAGTGLLAYGGGGGKWMKTAAILTVVATLYFVSRWWLEQRA